MDKKKILYIIPVFPVRTETFISREVTKLIELGNLDITVLSSRAGDGEISDTVREHVVYKGFNVFTSILELPLSLFQFLVRSPKKFFEVRKYVFKHLLADNRVQVKPKWLFFAKSLVYARLISKFSPDHIHVHFMSWPSTFALVASRLLDIPYSITAHAKDIFVEAECVSEKVKTAKFIAVCNKFAHEKVLEGAGEGVDTSNVHLIYHGVPIEEFAYGRTTGSTKKVSILTVARLVEKKGLNYLINAAKMLKDKNLNFELNIIGGGPLYKDLLAQINDLGLSDRVHILGEGEGLPYSQVRSFYQKADIFCLPSIETGKGDADGVPNTVVEASFAQLAVVTTNAGSITDLIDDNTGVLVLQRDEKALAEGLARLILDADLRAALGKNAHQKATHLFNLTENTKKVEELF